MHTIDFQCFHHIMAEDYLVITNICHIVESVWIKSSLLILFMDWKLVGGKTFSIESNCSKTFMLLFAAHCWFYIFDEIESHKREYVMKLTMIFKYNGMSNTHIWWALAIQFCIYHQNLLRLKDFSILVMTWNKISGLLQNVHLIRFCHIVKAR